MIFAGKTLSSLSFDLGVFQKFALKASTEDDERIAEKITSFYFHKQKQVPFDGLRQFVQKSYCFHPLLCRREMETGSRHAVINFRELNHDKVDEQFCKLVLPEREII